MSDLMLLDAERALELHHRMTVAAEDLEDDARALLEPLADASELLRGATPDVPRGLSRTATDLREQADGLRGRIAVVLAGGADMNAGLAALERIRVMFTAIESRGKPARGDGILSRRDLEWARNQLDDETSEAAEWLLNHDDFFDRVETAKHNDEYITNPYSGEFAYDPTDRDGRLSLDDIDAFIAKTEAWATLLPHASLIDIAGRGGQPDGRLSRRDFESFLADYDLPPETAAAVRQVLDDRAYHHPDSVISWSEALDMVSFVPVIGDVVDGARSIYYALHGDWAMAGIYALGLVPLPGLSGSGVTAAVRVVKHASDTLRKSGLKTAAGETGQALVKGTTYNWTASTVIQSVTPSAKCNTTMGWLADQAGIDVAKLQGKAESVTQGPLEKIANRLWQADGYDLGITGGFFSDSCETIAKRAGEHKLSKMWLPN